MTLPTEQHKSEREEFKSYLRECDEYCIVPDVGGAFHAGYEAARASMLRPIPTIQQSLIVADHFDDADKLVSERVNRILDALRIGRVACEWAEKHDEVKKIGAAMDDARALLRPIPEVEHDEILIAIKRPEDYEDVHPDLVAEDALQGMSADFEWRLIATSFNVEPT